MMRRLIYVLMSFGSILKQYVEIDAAIKVMRKFRINSNVIYGEIILSPEVSWALLDIYNCAILDFSVADTRQNGRNGIRANVVFIISY